MIREIVKHPDKRLRVPSLIVTSFDDELRMFIDDLAETMYASGGIGISAVQAGRHQRAFLVDLTDGYDLKVFVNPIVEMSKEKTISLNEGCLSIPASKRNCVRSERVKVKAHDQFGKPFELEVDGLLAIAIQHENDHLNGVLMID